MRSASFYFAALTMGLCIVGCSGADGNSGSESGNPGAGGHSAVGGSSTTNGGKTTTGGAAPTGGLAATGGASQGQGGSPSGTGGKAAGGAAVTGGSAATGGAAVTGGSTAVGGVTATGGAAARTGGTTATGGANTSAGGSTPGAGGTTATGGKTASSGGSTSTGTGGATTSTGGATTSTGGTVGTVTTVYRIIQGHDGDADPDDNLAQLAGMMAIHHNKGVYAGQIEMVGLVFGDTTGGHKTAMKGSGGGHGNWLFFQQYSTPALGDSTRDWYLPANIHDCVSQSWNFSATQVSQLSTGGQMVYRTIKAALDNTDASKNFRVVYAAGGGANAVYEAIQLLRKSTSPVYNDTQILAHFAIVQHSNWNMDNTYESGVLTGTLPFTIRISDQNGSAGPGKCGVEPSAAKTSTQFVTSSRVARGAQAPDQPMAGFQTTTDCSDAGESDFASTPSLMDKNWNTRNNRNNAVGYNAFDTAKIKSILQ